MRGITMASAMLLAGCGGGDGSGGGGSGDAGGKTEIAAKLGAGLYEVTADVASLASTDKTTPATKVKQGDKVAI